MKTNQSFQLNIPISKVDEEQRIVTGIATTEALDSQGDIVDYEASKKAFKEWAGNIREMHGSTAVGKAIDIQFDDVNKQVILSSYISESADGQNAWTKIKEGILTGYSIGGRIKEVMKDKAHNGANRILNYELSETSLVDKPANYEAQFMMVKSADGGGLQHVEEMIKSDDLTATLREVAETIVNLGKEQAMAKEESEQIEKTNVVGGEERDHNAEVTQTQEEAGRPSDDTTERAAAVEEKPADAAEDKGEEKPAEDAEEEKAEDKAADEDEDAKDKKKADGVADLVKSVETLLTKLDDNKDGVELKKALGDFQKSIDKVASEVTALEGRVKAIEDAPVPTKAKATYSVITKGDDSEVVVDERAELVKRQEAFMADPLNAAPGEAEAIAKGFRALAAAEANNNAKE